MNHQLKENLEINNNKSYKIKRFKNQSNELKLENVNLKFKLEYELNYNK